MSADGIAADQTGQVPRRQKPRLPARPYAFAQQDADPGVGAMRIRRPIHAEYRLGNSGTGSRPISALGLGRRQPKGGSPPVSSRPLNWFDELMAGPGMKNGLFASVHRMRLAKYHLLIKRSLGFVPLSKRAPSCMFEVFEPALRAGQTILVDLATCRSMFGRRYSARNGSTRGFRWTASRTMSSYPGS